MWEKGFKQSDLGNTSSLPQLCELHVQQSEK